MSNDIAELCERLRDLQSKATPELFAAKPHRVAQMLRDGARCQIPKPDNLEAVDFETDGLFLTELLAALPTLLATITHQQSQLDELRAGLRLAEQFLDKAVALANGAYRTSHTVLAKRLAEVRDECAALNATPHGEVR